MAYPITISASAMRDINRSAILEIIRQESPISRTSIAHRLNLSLPTVMRIVDELMDEGFVCPHGESEWSGGRRRQLLKFNAEGYVVLGIDLGGTKLYGAISDLGGKILDEVNIERHDSSGEESYNLLVTLIDSLLNSSQLQGRRVRGIGVGVPGVTLHQEGVVVWAYTLNWKDFPLKSRLAERYNLPITVDNDVNLAALGELWFGAGQKTQNMVLVTIGTGIGAGIIINGAIYRGANEASGEIGYMIPGREFLGGAYQEFGALERIASGTGIAQRARQAIELQGIPYPPDHLLSEDVFNAARKGEKWAQEVVTDTVDYLAIAIANLAVTLDPEVIVLGGGVARSADLLIEPILQRVRTCVPNLPRLELSKLGRRAAVMGAITNVIHNTANIYVVHKLS